jgi:hypothetical protein
MVGLEHDLSRPLPRNLASASLSGRCAGGNRPATGNAGKAHLAAPGWRRHADPRSRQRRPSLQTRDVLIQHEASLPLTS